MAEQITSARATAKLVRVAPRKVRQCLTKFVVSLWLEICNFAILQTTAQKMYTKC